MIQVIAENIFFFNPGVLWISHVMREERENCCDDVALKYLRSKKQYIQALVSFKERASFAKSYITAFPAGRNQLLKRVSRIIHNRNNTLDRAGKTVFFASFCVLTLLALAATSWRTGSTITSTVKALTTPSTMRSAPGVPLPDTAKLVAHLYVRGRSKVRVSKPAITGTNLNLLNRSDIAKSNELVAEVSKNAMATSAIVEESKEIFFTPGEPIQEFTEAILAYSEQPHLHGRAAEKDREQAITDRKRAELDRMQAQKDREQASKDMQQAAIDRIQAERDREQAARDRQQAQRERQEAAKERLLLPRQPVRHV